MTVERGYLNPRNTLVDEVVRYLVPRAREDGSGARSLSHILVIVPTAQSARSLRLALAEAFSPRGILPPRIEMPNALLVDGSALVATEAEELATLAKLLMDSDPGEFGSLFPKTPQKRGMEWALAMAESILGIYSILGGRAMLMDEVAPFATEDEARWRDLSKIESVFFAALGAKGMISRGVSRRNAAKRGCVDESISEILLPAAVDLSGAFEEYLSNSCQRVVVLIHADESEAARFDEWGRPVTMFAANVAPADVFPAPSAVVEADEIALCFREVAPADALPALAVCDPEMYPELEGAFQNHFDEDELALRNPSRESFVRSALGRLLLCMLGLSKSGDYDTFSTFVRTGDIARWAASRLGVDAPEVARIVGRLDRLQNEHLPRTMEDVARYAEDESPDLARLVKEIKASLEDPFAFLRSIFATLVLDERESADRELIAAAKVARDLRAECQSQLVPPFMRNCLYERLLKRAEYMLEPIAPHVLSTIGWLEIPWCAEDELVIAGFNEGCVPESVVGHQFLPDSLRARLGLMTNAVRAMRDSFIFAEATRCRARGAVSIHLHQRAGDKSVLKPSRILFEGIGDDDLPALAMRLYAVLKGASGVPPKELPEAWRLKLPIPPRGVVWRERISVTALDRYRRCPFEFFLAETFGEGSDDRLQEMDAATFGSLCHGALEDFARSAVKDSTDESEIGDFLEGAVKRRLMVFGESPPLTVGLQGEAAISRLRAFSRIQAARRREGWRIVKSECRLECTFRTCPTRVVGKIDRIDVHEATGELAIIDYKTWRLLDESKTVGIQLPAYRAMVEACGLFDAGVASRARAMYCVLAERAEDTIFAEAFAHDGGDQSEQEDFIVGLLERLARGVFYPPAKDSAWRETYGNLIWESPELGVDQAWLDDQAARRGE